MDYEKNIEIPFGAKDSELKGWEYTIPEGFTAEIKDGKVIVREKESEDERIIEEIKFAVLQMKTTREDTRQRCLTWLEKQKEQKPEIISISEMVSKYRSTDEYDDGNYKGKPANCMIRAYEQGIRDTLLKLKEQKPAEYGDDVVEEAEEYTSKVDCGEYGVAVTEAYIAGVLSERNRKPAEWSEEDDALLKEIVSFFKDGTVKLQHDLDLYAGFLENKFKSLRPQPNLEWNEEDEKKITFLERLIRYNVPEGQYGWADGHRGGFVTKLEAISMLKSLRPSWKPSEEQMEALNTVLEHEAERVGSSKELEKANALYEQLQRL